LKQPTREGDFIKKGKREKDWVDHELFELSELLRYLEKTGSKPKFN